MLVLTRNAHESIFVTTPAGARLVFTVVEVRGSNVRIGIEAPRDFQIERDDIVRGSKSIQSSERDVESLGRRHDPLGVAEAYDEQTERDLIDHG